MRTGFYFRLAVSNIRKNSKTYIPYILTCIMTVTMFYLVKSLSLNPGIEKMVGSNIIAFIMELGTYIIGLFALIFLFYTNSFLLKRRKKEFGLFNILGMEKKHLSGVLFLETLLIALVSLGVGLVFGIALDKAMFLLIARIIGGNVTLGFYVSMKAVKTTAVLFCSIFLLIYFKSVYTIRISNPIELLRGGNMGEKEPKTKWLLALVGAILLGVGYYLALIIKNPITAINAFFVAVLLVIIATYLLFTAGSIAMLKLMRKNQRFYYRTKHFISVSGMIYRMKQNAVGLANICILSTMVLIMVSSTTSLMVGLEDLIQTRYPNDFIIYSSETEEWRNEELYGKVDRLCEEFGVPMTAKRRYSYLACYVCEREDDFITEITDMDFILGQESYRLLMFIPLSDYNASTGESRQLQDHEILFFSNREKYTKDVLHLLGEEYRIKEELNDFFGIGAAESNIVTSYYCVVRDADFEQLLQIGKEEFGVSWQAGSYYGFDTPVDEELQQKLFNSISNIISTFGLNGYMESRLGSKTSFLSLYGGIFFLGVFLGTLFIMATVLIIYYKQISEGYEDRERFAILQKVGMTQSEVKSAIHSQVLTVFFLPLVVAGIHTAVAFPLVSLLLALLNMVNVKLYLACTAVCFFIFMVMYVLIYSLTAKTYYKIVSR